MKSILVSMILAASFILAQSAMAQAIVVTTDQWQDWRWREHNYQEWRHWQKHHNNEWQEWRSSNREDYDRWCYYHRHEC